jgi:Tol biopolymer transport system component
MTGHDDLDRTLAGWFEADALAPTRPGDLERALDATRRRRPRPAWLARPGSRWVGTAGGRGPSSGVPALPRLGVGWATAALVLLAVMALVGGMILVGARLIQPSPLPGRLGQLAYGLDGDIYLADWDGRNAIQVADGDPFDDTNGESYSLVAWAPDGRHFLYQETGRAQSVHIGDAKGRVVASFDGVDYSTGWSPDSTRIQAWTDTSSGIAVYGLDGRRQAVLALPRGYGRFREYPAAWTRDGRSVLVRLARIDSATAGAELWELPISGGAPRRLPTEDPRSRFDAVYSPDGARVAFVGLPDSYSLVVAEADGTELRVLPGAPNSFNEGPGAGENHRSPVWSPSGDRVAFTRSVFDGSGRQDDDGPVESAVELRVVEVSSGNVTTLAAGADIYAIGFSPEADQILFVRNNSLWSANADGSGVQLLVPETSSGGWQWRPAAP